MFHTRTLFFCILFPPRRRRDQSFINAQADRKDPRRWVVAVINIAPSPVVVLVYIAAACGRHNTLYSGCSGGSGRKFDFTGAAAILYIERG